MIINLEGTEYRCSNILQGYPYKVESRLPNGEWHECKNLSLKLRLKREIAAKK